MPRYRFSWDYVPDPIVTSLATALRIEGDPRAGLRATYGRRPKSVFVQDTWPVLLESWLPTDDDMRTWIVDMLKENGLGEPSIDTSDLDGQMAYLRSCRNAGTLRTIVLAAFHAIGEPDYAVAPLATDSTHDSGTGAASTAVIDAVPGESLEDWLLRTLSEVFEVAIERDADGDIPVPRGSSVTFLRADKENPILDLFAPVVSGMPVNESVFEAVNTINTQLRIPKAIVIADGTGIVIGASIPADSLSVDGLMYAINEVSTAADYFDTLLAERFGGTTMLQDESEEPVDV